MKLFRHITMQTVNWFLTYCLGPQRAPIADKNRLILLKGEPEMPVASSMNINEDALIIIVTAEQDVRPFSHLRNHKLLIMPRVLEEVVPMLNELWRSLLSTATIVVHDLSRLPCKRELKNIVGSSTNRHAFARECMRLKRVAQKNQWQMIVIDQEETVGKKNSALLRRLFSQYN